MATREITPKEKQEVKETDETRPGRYYVPDVDISEDDSSLRLWADMPGVREDKVTVDFDNDVLTIRGEVSLEDYEGMNPVYTEYNVGSFVRRFTLSSSARFDIDGIAANVARGVLEITIPKLERARQRRVPVRVVEH